MNNEIMTVSADKISKFTGFSSEQIAVIKKTVAKNTSDIELAFFLSVSQSTGLDPFLKEIWCYKDNSGNLLVFAGRDGFLKKAQSSNVWNGITSSEVCENDVFERGVDYIKHSPNYSQPRGKIIGAYAIVRPKGCDLSTIEWADFARYNKGRNTWTTHPEEMIKKVAEVHALKKAYGITGLQSEYDFQVEGTTVMPIETAPDELDIMKDNIMLELESYDGDDKEEIKEMCIEKQRAGEFTESFAKNIAHKLGMKA